MEYVYWVMESSIHDGKLEELKRVLAKLVEQAKTKEPDTLAYEWWIDAAQKKLHVYEAYKDSAAIITHATNTGPLIGELIACMKLERMVIYGNPNETVRSIFAGFNPTYMGLLGGFARGR